MRIFGWQFYIGGKDIRAGEDIWVAVLAGGEDISRSQPVICFSCTTLAD